MAARWAAILWSNLCIESAASVTENFAVHAYPAPVGTFGVKFLCTHIAIIQLRPVLQRVYKRIYDMPKLVAERGT